MLTAKHHPATDNTYLQPSTQAQPPQRSTHLPGNADVLEEKYELKKALGFCHHSYQHHPRQAQPPLPQGPSGLRWGDAQASE